MLKSTFSGRLLEKLIPVCSGLSSSNSFGCCDCVPRSQAANASIRAANGALNNRKLLRGMPNARMLGRAFLALCHRHMVSINTRVATFVAISWLTTACVSSNAVHPKELTDDGKTIAPHSPNTVTSDDLDRAGDDAIIKTLSAKVPGVWVSTTADGSLAVRVRGSNS